MAMPKLSSVPANTYSVLGLSLSLKRSMDLAAIMNPMASNSPKRTKHNVSRRSNEPMSAPASLACEPE